MRKISTTLLFIVLSIGSVYSQTSWIGTAADNDWTNPANWNNGVPSAATGNTVIDGDQYAAANYPIISSAYLTNIKLLLVRDGGRLDIEGNLTGDGTNAADIRVSNGAVINHAAGTVSGFDDFQIDGGTLNVSGTANLQIDDDIKFEDLTGDATTNGTGGTINISGGSVSVGAGGSGQIDFNGLTGNVVNITGGSLAVEEIVDPAADSEVNENGGDLTIDGSSVITVLDGATLNTVSETITEDIIINPGGVLNISASSTTNFQGNILNNGTFTTAAGGTAQFNGGTQTISGNQNASFNIVQIGNSVATALVLSIDISVAGNWTVSGGSTFTANTGTATFNGSSAQAISNANTFFNLVVNNSSGISLSGGDCTVTNQFTLTTGVVSTTSSAMIVIADGATSNEGAADSYIDGPIKKIGQGAFVFPTGDGANWARIAISDPANATVEFTAEYVASGLGSTDIDAGSAASIDHVSVFEYWNLNRTGTSSDVTVTLYWETGTGTGIMDLADLRVVHHDGTDWDNIGGTGVGTTTAGTISSNTTGTFSPFTFGSSTEDNTLPVTWLSFEGMLYAGHVELSWSTATEVDNKGFFIEKSADGIYWSEIGFVDGAGISNRTLEYSFTDLTSPAKYYRLKQVDYDGEYDYSYVVSISLNEDYKVYFSSTTSEVVIKSSKVFGQLASLSVFNLQGELLIDKAVEITNSSMFVDLKIDSGQLLIAVLIVDGKVQKFKFLN
ncbi:hypothetical protein [Reichenbachiella versicolor]|uniref:hypothetical protein n=1 Tax=Reichenbachiella versicolor TaxID=1821036 RepID=UPI000D6EA8D7|nr:hypothetical protein [Reichenbachiella versicolor]